MSLALSELQIDLMCLMALTVSYLTLRQSKDLISRNLLLCVLWLTVTVLCDLLRIVSTSQAFEHVYPFSLGLLFGAIGLTCAYWMRFTASQLSFHRKPPRWRNLAVTAPAIAFALFCITSYWHGLLMADGPALFLSRGPLFWILAVCCFGYLMTALMCVFYEYLISDSLENRRSSLILSVFTLGAISGGIMQYLTNMQWVISCSTVCVVFYIVTMHEDLVSRDVLSGLNNRSRFSRYLNERYEQLCRGGDAWLLFVDIDRFKEINDRYGHLAGDRAISMVGEMLHLLAGDSGAFAARYGGDEFVMVMPHADPGFIERCDEILNSHAELSSFEKNLPFTVSLSVGAVRISQGQGGAQALVKSADSSMYRDKLRHHRKDAERTSGKAAGEAGAETSQDREG